jgi:hypothetical protein
MLVMGEAPSGGIVVGAGADGGSGWPIAMRMAAISCCCSMMISCAMRRSWGFFP